MKKLTNISKLLVPVDMTEASIPAVEAAVTLSRGKPTRISLLHVQEVPEVHEVQDSAGHAGNSGNAMEEFFLRKVKSQSKFAYIVRNGNPADEILTYARDEGVDIIVLPIGAGLPGSRGTADRVIAESPVPVVIVRAASSARKEKTPMPYDQQYLAAIREKVCAKCIDRTPSGLCVASTFDACAINRYLPEIIEIVLNTESDTTGPYVEKLREKVCAVCRHQSPDGVCDLRDDVECALDRYYPLVIEAIREAR